MSLQRIFSLLLLCLPYTAWAATYTVDRMDDSAAATGCSDGTVNDCSLRGAVIKANLDVAADTIVIPAGTYTVDIARGGADETGQDTANQFEALGDIDIHELVTITGAGAGTTIISGGAAFNDRLFHLDSNTAGTITFDGLTLDGNDRPSSGRGGLFYIVSGAGHTVLIDNCDVKNGNATDGGAVAMNNSDLVIIRNSTLSDNTASDRGGGFFCETGTCQVINSTISNNAAGTGATGGGGAIDNSTGALTIINSTLVNNTTAAGSTGGGLRVGASVTMKNSIIAGNTFNGTAENCDDAITSGGYNVSDDASCALAGTGDQSSVATTILNSTLADNGGTTDTHTLVASSVAIDAVPAASCLDASSVALTEDQRGFERPLTATGAATSCDAGAVEVGCGNQVVEAAEVCDEAGAATATCDSDCTAVTCGDGTLNTAAGEACEDGNTTAGDGCSATCATEAGTAVVCGNGILQEDEICDDGNTTSGDGCSSECATEAEGLTTDNPDVDFFTLTIGEAVSLVAPSPGAVASVRALGLAVAASEDTCDCEWSTAPTTMATFSDASTCATALTPVEAGDGSLSVVVDCGDSGSETFTQSLTVASAVAAASTGGGCSLQTRSVSGTTQPIFTACVFLLAGFFGLKKRAELAK